MNRFLVALACAILSSAAAAAPAEVPAVFAKLKPKVGSWAEYSVVTEKGDAIKSKGTFRIAVVGKTDDGIWIEERMTPEIPKPRHPEAATIKLLTGGGGVLKAYMKTSRGVMDMSSMMARSANRKQAAVDAAKRTEVGVETIAVPAGRFKATHYAFQHEKGSGDMWVKAGAGPWGLIKQVHSSDGRVATIELLASGGGAKSEVDETTARAFPGMGMGGAPAQADRSDDDADDSGAQAPQTPSASSIFGDALKSRLGH